MIENQNSEAKKKRYPSDRLKLHAMLGKKEQELHELQDEVQELCRRVKQADFTAINATAAMYNVTPEQFEQIMQALRSENDRVIPPLPVKAQEAAKVPAPEKEISDEEDDSNDDEDA